MQKDVSVHWNVSIPSGLRTSQGSLGSYKLEEVCALNTNAYYRWFDVQKGLRARLKVSVTFKVLFDEINIIYLYKGRGNFHHPASDGILQWNISSETHLFLPLREESTARKRRHFGIVLAVIVTYDSQNKHNLTHIPLT